MYKALLSPGIMRWEVDLPLFKGTLVETLGHELSYMELVMVANAWHSRLLASALVLVLSLQGLIYGTRCDL